MRKILYGVFALALSVSSVYAQGVNGGGGQTVNGQPLGGSGSTGANPSATASDTAVNGSATTFMRSDAAPAVQKGSASQFGVVKVDGSTITATGGVISSTASGGNANFGTATGNTANNFVGMANTTTGVKDLGVSASSFAPAGVVTVVTGSNPTTNAASWLAFTQYTIAGSGRTITLPASSGLNANGGLDIDANTNSVTLTANAADTITWAGSTTGTGGSVTLPAGAMYRVSTDAAGKIYVSGRDVQGTGVKTQLFAGSTPATNDCAKFDSNKNITTSGAACGGTFTPALPNYIAGNTYLAQPYVGLATGSAFGNTNASWMPVMVNKTLTISAIGAKLITADSGQNCQFAIYASDATTNKPTGSALASTANVSTTSAGNISGSVSLQLTANTLYFMGAMCSGTTAAFEGFSITNDSLNGYLLGGSGMNGSGANAGQIGLNYGTTGLTFGTWPTNPTVTYTSSNGSTLKNFVAMFTVGSVP